MKRHGDGRPSRPDWYQPIDRKRNCFTAPPGRQSRRRPPTTDRTSASNRGPAPSRTGTSQGRNGRCGCASTLAPDGEYGCGRPPTPPTGRSQRRCSERDTRGRAASRTRGLHCEHVFPRGATARTRGRDGGDRSSRQPVPALEPTGLQNGATAARRHTRPEAMLHRPALLVGLISALHENSSKNQPETGLGDVGRLNADAS